MSARTKMVLLLLLAVVGATIWNLHEARTSIAPEEVLLARWQRAAQSVKTVQGKVHLYHYDPIWGDKESEGSFWYTADHKGAYLHRPLAPDHPDDWYYLEWDKNQVIFVENHYQEIRIVEIPLHMRTKSALTTRKVARDNSWLSEGFLRWAMMLTLPSEHLPMILPREGKFWADEFHWKPIPGLAGWLTADPIETEEKCKPRFDIIMDSKTGLPLGVQRHEPGPGKQRLVWIVHNLKVNTPINNIAPAFDETSPKWKVIRDSVPKYVRSD